MFTMPDVRRARINLSFDLTDPGEAAVYKTLFPLAKSRKATAYITELVLKKMNEDAEKALGITTPDPAPTPASQTTKRPQPVAAAQEAEKPVDVPSDDGFNDNDAMDVLDIFGS